ncbi:hypothetical protein [Mangrovicella endophytica]|uniref:hypothetical protein n=1 Tax=Mangrovicella endophytica TaxID=2066697 RepID=UPI001FDF5AE5|nr:hypothetical protein [Mangrovicella endophytica]
MSESISRTLKLGSLGAMLLAGALAGCASKPQPARPVAADTGLDRMERLTLTANRCWFKSGDPAFTRYSLAPELSSFSGRPRFLLVPRGKPEARPLLVVEGQRGSSAVAVYGPLTQEPIARRIDADLSRWRAGGNGCNA